MLHISHTNNFDQPFGPMALGRLMQNPGINSTSNWCLSNVGGSIYFHNSLGEKKAFKKILKKNL